MLMFIRKYINYTGGEKVMFKRVDAIGLSLLFVLGSTACGKKQEEVVVYTAVDQVFADEIFAMFEEETGMKVRAVYDTEANKTTGLTNRIIA